MKNDEQTTCRRLNRDLEFKTKSTKLRSEEQHRIATRRAVELPRASCKREADGSCQRRVGCQTRVTIAFPILRRRCV